MRTKNLTSTFRTKAALALSIAFFGLTASNLSAQQVVLDSHSAANGASTWNITTTHANELIIISAGGYAWSTQLSTAPGTVTVNGNNATYETEGLWVNVNFSWQEEIWAYVAPTPGVYVCKCTENGLSNPFYFNYACSVYQPNCPVGLTLGNVLVGGNANNHGPTTITAAITTTENGAWVYGSVDNNDNGGTGVVKWNNQLTELDHTYINNGVDGAQADSTYALAGTYNITSTDIGASNVWMTLALIAVQPNPSCCSLTATASVDADVLCNGGATGSATALPAHGHAPYTYAWAPGAQTNAIATGLSAGTYTVTVSDTIGCSATASVTITQPTLLTASMGVPANVLCNGGATGSATVTAGGGTVPYTYSWLPSGGSNAAATAITAGTYTVTVKDNNACTATASVVITQPATALAVSVTGPAMLCIGATGTLSAPTTGGTAPYAYAWSPGIASTTSTASITPVTSQTYSVTVTDANGCTASGDVTVNLGPPLAASVSGSGSICSGRSTSLCATAIGGTGGNTYLWQPGNMATPCVKVNPTSTTTYTVSVADNCGTTATLTTTVNVNPLPVIDFSADIYQGCTPLCTQFRNASTLGQGGAGSYAWAFGNGDTLLSENPIYCYHSSGSFNVSLTVTSDSGCSATLNKTNMITTFQRPAASFTYSPNPINILAPTVQFNDNSTDKYGIALRTWSFGDGTASSNLENPSHTYQDTGNYCANLIVMDAHGCTDTASNCFVIDPVFNLYIPSAFSPNGDGKNDVFQARGQYIKSFEMYIFDRWGMEIFHSTDINQGWNGSVKGGSNVAQEDTYIYKIMVTDAQDHQHTYTGNVSIIK